MRRSRRQRTRAFVAGGLLLALHLGACGDVGETGPRPPEKREPVQPMPHDGLVRGFTRLSLPPMGEPLALDLHVGGALGVNVPGARRDVRLALERASEAPHAFTLRIQAPGGALQQAKGPNTDLAPESGFDHDEERVRGDDSSPHQLLHYFVRLTDGSYARLTLWLRTQSANNHARISIRTSHNPRGRRLDTFDGWDHLPVEPPIGFISPRSRARTTLP